MAEIKWIKIVTDIFDNRKIRQIEFMPEGDSIIVIWLKLLCLAGETNDNGQIYITKEVPYTEQTLAIQFNRPLTIVQLALKVLVSFGMIEIIDDLLMISNWEKYQNIEGMEKIREQNRIRKRNQRERERQLLTDSHVMSRDSHATDIDIEEDKDIDKEIKNNNKPIRHKYGEYNNVLLSDEDMEKLKKEFPDDYEKRIENLSSYMKSTGKSYKDHLATIRNWARKESKPKSKVNEIDWDNV